ncbi:MAG: hypothetical protein ACRD3T_19460 [Terriglobia bacterium]
MGLDRLRWIEFLRAARAKVARRLALGILVWLASAAGMRAAPSGSSFLVIYGTAAAVTPNSVTVQGTDLKQVTISTQDDFTQKVAIGSKVTAWYYAEGNGYALRWLSYSLENDFVAPARILSQVKSVALLPDSKMQGADGLVDQIAGFMKDNLGWRVAPKMWAAYIRRQSQKNTSTLNAFDAKTGKFDMNRYVHGEDNLISTLTRRARVNAVLEIQIEKVEAPVSHEVAVWDGVQDQLSGKTMRTISKMDVASRREGKVPAATVVLKLWSPQQQLLWSNRRGFAALERYQGVRDKLESWPLENSLVNSQNVDRWLKMVFASFLEYATPPKRLD